MVGTYAKLVDDRNESAHPNGNIFYSTEAALAAKINEVLRVVDEIQWHSKPVIEHCYSEFLLQNRDPSAQAAEIFSDLGADLRQVVLVNRAALSAKAEAVVLDLEESEGIRLPSQ
jgi:hypothetical protein